MLRRPSPRPTAVHRCARLLLAPVVAAFACLVPAAAAHAASPAAAGSASPTTSHTPVPVVSPWQGPLTQSCPPVAKTVPHPAVTAAPSALPTAPPDGPIGGPQLGSAGVVVNKAAGVPAVPDITASSWVIADADTGEVLAAKDPHGHYRPASTLKTLTAVTLIPRLDPCQVYTASYKDASTECTCVPVVGGTAYRVKMLFTGMLVVSGNDAANALAGAYGGVPRTVAAMNAEAKYLKAYDTHAGDPSGLDAPGEVSSAYDLALIGRAGLQLPDFRAYVDTRHAQWPMPKGKTELLISHDHLLANYDGAIGIKNGFTIAAQATFIGAATRGGHTIIATLMHSTVGTQVWREDAALLDWGFAALGKVAPVGQLVEPDVAPTPSPSGSPTSAAAIAAPSGPPSPQPAPTSKLAPVVKAAATRASTGGVSLAVPLSIAIILVIGAFLSLTALHRRRRRKIGDLERALRF